MEQTTNTAGRAGISYEQVAKVAEDMKAGGTRPTLRGVREKLGTGSLGTIQKHLNKWQEAARDSTAPALSNELVTAISREIAGRVREAQADAEALLENNAQLAMETERLEGVIETLRAALAETGAQAQALQGKIEALTAEIDGVKREAAERVQASEEKAAAAVATAQAATDKEVQAREAAQVALAKAELRLEALPRIGAELDQVRADGQAERAARVEAERALSGVTASLKAAEIRMADLTSTIDRERAEHGKTLAELQRERTEHEARVSELLGTTQREREANAKALAELLARIAPEAKR